LTSTLNKAEEDFIQAGIRHADSPFLGKLSYQEKQLIQLIAVENLLPEEVRVAILASMSGLLQKE
jgi:hypothetical protein